MTVIKLVSHEKRAAKRRKLSKKIRRKMSLLYWLKKLNVWLCLAAFIAGTILAIMWGSNKILAAKGGQISTRSSLISALFTLIATGALGGIIPALIVKGAMMGIKSLTTRHIKRLEQSLDYI